MMRDDFEVGDLVLFYHSNCKPPHVAGVAQVSKQGYPDFTSWDASSNYFERGCRYCARVSGSVCNPCQRNISRLSAKWVESPRRQSENGIPTRDMWRREIGPDTSGCAGGKY
jgi:hypothetical protein